MSPSDSPDIVMQYQDSGSSYVPYKYLFLGTYADAAFRYVWFLPAYTIFIAFCNSLCLY